jgi:F-type H+/Na+-transporting ATPase subunit alpha
MAQQVLVLFAGVNGFVDDVPVPAVRKFEIEFLAYVNQRKPELLKAVAEKKVIEDDLKAQIESALREFKAQFKAQ